MNLAVEQTVTKPFSLECVDSASHVGTKFFPHTFVPGDNDVIIGRGKKCSQHIGNMRLRSLVASMMDEYSATSTKNGKSHIILRIISQVRMGSPTGVFVKQDPAVGLWYDVGDFLAREKVSQTFRDALHNNYRSSNEFKKKRRREQSTQVISEKTRSKRPRVDTRPCQLSEELLLNDRRNDVLMDLDVLGGPVKPTDIPHSAALTRWFEDTSDVFLPVPELESFENDESLFDFLMVSTDFEESLEELIDDMNLEPAEKDSIECPGSSQSFMPLPTCNSVAARTA